MTAKRWREIKITIIRLATHFVHVNSRVCKIIPHVYKATLISIELISEFNEDIIAFE